MKIASTVGITTQDYSQNAGEREREREAYGHNQVPRNKRSKNVISSYQTELAITEDTASQTETHGNVDLANLWGHSLTC